MRRRLVFLLAVLLPLTCGCAAVERPHDDAAADTTMARPDTAQMEWIGIKALYR